MSLFGNETFRTNFSLRFAVACVRYDRSPDIRKNTWCSELSEREFGITKIN